MKKDLEVNTWQVYEWYLNTSQGGGWKFHLEYSGESLFKAFWKMFKLKREGAACLKLEWRPQLKRGF